MKNQFTLGTVDTPQSPSPELTTFIRQLEIIQSEQDRISSYEVDSSETSIIQLADIDELEQRLVIQEVGVLESILNFRSRSLDDILAKLQVWKRCVAPGNPPLEEFSLPEQIAISALNDLEAA